GRRSLRTWAPGGSSSDRWRASGSCATSGDPSEPVRLRVGRMRTPPSSNASSQKFSKEYRPMPVEVRVPTLGESVVEATIGAWLKHEGDQVEAGEPLVSLETQKVNGEVAADKA